MQASRLNDRSRGILRSALCVALLALSGCVSTALVEHWKSPGFAGSSLHKVLVVGEHLDAGQRRVWESAMVDALAKHHVAATASYLLYPDQPPTAAQLVATAQRQGFDGVLATRFIGAGRRTYWVPGGWDYGWEWGWGWGWGWPGFGPGPGYVRSDYLANYETDIYTVGPDGGHLIWSGVTRSVDPTSLTALTAEISAVLVPALVHEQILAPT
jgi:hypothetical protein